MIKYTNEIQNLVLSVFDDNDYNKFIEMYHNYNYNGMRLMVDEHIMLLQAERQLTQYSIVADYQLRNLNKLEDYVMDLCAEYFSL